MYALVKFHGPTKTQQHKEQFVQQALGNRHLHQTYEWNVTPA